MRNRTPTISPGSEENVVGTIHMSWAKSVAGPRAMATSSIPRRRNIDEPNGSDIMVVLVSICGAADARESAIRSIGVCKYWNVERPREQGPFRFNRWPV